MTHVERLTLVAELTSDYFIDKNNVFEKIFEKKKNSTLNDDKWPHFVKFNYLQETNEMLEFKVPSHLDSSFADSFNSGVKPIPISEQDITKLCGIMKNGPIQKYALRNLEAHSTPMRKMYVRRVTTELPLEKKNDFWLGYTKHVLT